MLLFSCLSSRTIPFIPKKKKALKNENNNDVKAKTKVMNASRRHFCSNQALPLVQLLQLQLLIRRSRRRKKLHGSVQWTILTI